MLHLVCLYHRRDNLSLRLLCIMLHPSVLNMDCASSAVSQVTYPENAPSDIINWSFTLLAVEMAMATTGPPTIILGLMLMLVDMLTILMLKKLRNNLLP